jgi:hypothetical protein
LIKRYRAFRHFPDERGYVMRVGAAVLEQGERVAERAGNAAHRRPAVVPTALSAAGGPLDPQDGRARQVREWLFFLLRFAITRDPDDELAVLMIANGIDSLGRQWGTSAPTFFRRSSEEVCEAIRALDDPGREAVLKKHILRIEHPGLRRAFQAAVHCQQVRAATS